jgi:hypothetical protein
MWILSSVVAAMVWMTLFFTTLPLYMALWCQHSGPFLLVMLVLVAWDTAVVCPMSGRGVAWRAAFLLSRAVCPYDHETLVDPVQVLQMATAIFDDLVRLAVGIVLLELAFARWPGTFSDTRRRLILFLCIFGGGWA